MGIKKGIPYSFPFWRPWYPFKTAVNGTNEKAANHKNLASKRFWNRQFLPCFLSRESIQSMGEKQGNTLKETIGIPREFWENHRDTVFLFSEFPRDSDGFLEDFPFFSPLTVGPPHGESQRSQVVSPASSRTLTLSATYFLLRWIFNKLHFFKGTSTLTLSDFLILEAFFKGKEGLGNNFSF